MTEITAEGVNGTVTFDGQFVTFQITGSIAKRFAFGKDQRRIPVSQISSTRWKQPGMLSKGYLAFTLAGAAEVIPTEKEMTSIGSWVDLFQRNVVVVAKKKAGEFDQLRDAVDHAIADRFATS